MKIRLGIVASEFNSSIMDTMVARALAKAKSTGCTVKPSHIIRVPGAYDAPLAVKKLLKMRGSSSVDAVVVLGAIITGETKHDELIANATAQALTSLSLEFEKPVMLGIIGPGADYAQAKARAGEYAERAVLGAKKMVENLRGARS